MYRRKKDTQMMEPTAVTPQKLNKPSPQGSKNKPQKMKKQKETRLNNESKLAKPETPTKPKEKNWEHEHYQPSEVQDLSILIWNVRGLNTKQKQHQVIDAIRQERIDVAMLTETRLNRTFRMDGMRVCQTCYQTKGGCLTASNMSSHRRVKQLGTHLSWSKISTTEGEVQLLTCYIAIKK